MKAAIQGCDLSLLLFNMYIEKSMKEVNEVYKYDKNTSRKNNNIQACK